MQSALLDIVNLTNYRPNQRPLKRLLSAALQVFALRGLSLSLVFVTPRRIRQLNKIYRGLDRPTDVLSFLYENKKGFIDAEIIICPRQAALAVAGCGADVDREIIQLFSHGIIHCLGYDHKTALEQKKMRLAEKKLISFTEKND